MLAVRGKAAARSLPSSRSPTGWPRAKPIIVGTPLGRVPGRPGTRPSGVPTMIGFALGQPVGDRLDGNDLAAAFPLTANIHTQPATADPLTVNYVWDVSTSDGTAKVID